VFGSGNFRWYFLFAALQMNASDRSLMNAFRDISAMADKLNLPRSIVVRYCLSL